MATWNGLLKLALEKNGETMSSLVYSTLSQEEGDLVFDDDFGYQEGVKFTAWTEQRVYFPAVFDGREWVASVPRNPCDERTAHIGC